MQKKTSNKAKENFFEKFSIFITQKTGSTGAFIIACLVVLVWIFTGPIFHYSDTWQLVINTGTTVVTFLMVFLIQKSQNKDSRAIQLKLNELIACNDKASNRLVDVEDISEAEMILLQKYFKKLSDMTKKEADLFASHSIEEAEELHREKISLTKKQHKTIKR